MAAPFYLFEGLWNGRPSSYLYGCALAGTPLESLPEAPQLAALLIGTEGVLQRTLRTRCDTRGGWKPIQSTGARSSHLKS